MTASTTSAPPATRVRSDVRPRKVRFDWQRTELHWLPGDPQTTHTVNVLHLLLPSGERWFCDVYRDALPLVTDDALRADVKGFIGQEATHARAHDTMLDHLASQSVDTTDYVERVEWLFTRTLGERPFGLRLPGWAEHRWLLRRLAIIAAIEHFTAVLGWWIVAESSALDDAGADPEMLALLRWHGAEEVEHRHVAHDLYVHVGGSNVGRIAAMVPVFSMMFVLWVQGTRMLMANDPSRPGRPSWRRFVAAGRRGVLPRFGLFIDAIGRYLRPGFDPRSVGDTATAQALLATSTVVAR